MQRKTILLLLLLKRCNDDRIFSAVNNPKSSHQRLKEGTCPAPFTSGPICYSCPSAELRTIEEVSFTPRPLYPHGKNSRYALPRNVSAHPPPPCLQRHAFPSTYETTLPLGTLEFLVDGNNFGKV